MHMNDQEAETDRGTPSGGNPLAYNKVGWPSLEPAGRNLVQVSHEGGRDQMLELWCVSGQNSH